ncbi:MAG: N-6 DNA methylase [Blastocatellia bacterium]|nr:N-6 DNA methylase [Blastocatellia bacterium]
MTASAAFVRRQTLEAVPSKKSGDVLSDAEIQTRKRTGAHYTPPELASFVADQIVAYASDAESPLSVLDPAIGDGALMEALALRLRNVNATGFDTDAIALAASTKRLRRIVSPDRLDLRQGDFPSLCLQSRGTDLFAREQVGPFDLIIANPPYVRTQVMGAARSQGIADAFQLSGRVDLYFSFLVCIASVLRSGGIAGVIVSNRFMTTRSGEEVRRRLLQEFDVLHVWDFGDTKLFEAAVLPAVLILRKKTRNGSAHATPRMSAIYTTDQTAETHAATVFQALQGAGAIEVNGGTYLIRHGTLEHGDSVKGVWRLGTEAGDSWLRTVQRHTFCTFGDIGKVRVGVKSTADKIFVRSDWHLMPPQTLPELLRPLMTHHHGRRYRADMSVKSTQILYPHESNDGRKKAVDLSKYPNAAAYLGEHRAQLEKRRYVIEAGREWFELWVPQNPNAWKLPKLVFPDISEKPIFWLDLEGAVVNGDCYWIAAQDTSNQDLLWLALGVGNSSFIEEFYDHLFHNKLYAGRRRFMTQYVEQFPVPNPSEKSSREIVRCAKTLHLEPNERVGASLQARIDTLVREAFGLGREKAPR